MGVDTSKYSDDSFDVEFIGRENDMERVKELLKENKTIGIFGMRKIGKSRFLVKLFQNMKKNGTICLIKDFEPDDITSSSIQYKWFSDLFVNADLHSEYVDLKSKYPGEKIDCGKCEQCDHKLSCDHKKDCLKQAIDAAILSLNSFNQQMMLFLDNVDKLIDSDLKDCILYFIHVISDRCPNVNLLFCSNNETNYSELRESYGSVILGPLEKDSILRLIYMTAELLYDEASKEDKEDVCHVEASLNDSSKTELIDGLFKQENKYFTPENRMYIEEIASLCAGHPVAAVKAGTLLTEDEGLLIPRELVEILKESILEGLCSTHCPP